MRKFIEQFLGNPRFSLTECDNSSPAAVPRMMRVPFLRDDDDRQGRREVDQKERALVHDDGRNRVRVM